MLFYAVLWNWHGTWWFNPKIIQFFKENLFRSRQPMTSASRLLFVFFSNWEVHPSSWAPSESTLNLRKPTACRNTCDRLPNPNILVTYKASDLKKDWWDSTSVKKNTWRTWYLTVIFWCGGDFYQMVRLRVWKPKTDRRWLLSLVPPWIWHGFNQCESYQPMVNWWVGARWFGIRIGVPLRIPIPSLFGYSRKRNWMQTGDGPVNRYR